MYLPHREQLLADVLLADAVREVRAAGVRVEVPIVRVQNSCRRSSVSAA
jgi:hypothetical protein